jgi:hypothetical protein
VNPRTRLDAVDFVDVPASYRIVRDEPKGGSTMTQLEFDHILNSIDALSPEQMRRLRGELDAKLATAENPSAPPLGSLGAMHDAAEELDAIVERAMKNRRERPWRLPPGE